MTQVKATATAGATAASLPGGNVADDAVGQGSSERPLRTFAVGRSLCALSGDREGAGKLTKYSRSNVDVPGIRCAFREKELAKGNRNSIFLKTENGLFRDKDLFSPGSITKGLYLYMYVDLVSLKSFRWCRRVDQCSERIKIMSQCQHSELSVN